MGDHTFSSLYGEAQERYFARGGYTEVEERVAGTPDFAFNEYELAAEGRWGLLLMVLVVGLVLLVDGFKKRSGLGGGMLAWMVFAFFSLSVSYSRTGGCGFGDGIGIGYRLYIGEEV